LYGPSQNGKAGDEIEWLEEDCSCFSGLDISSTWIIDAGQNIGSRVPSEFRLVPKPILMGNLV
jgi:hypothetical protein